MAQRSLEGSEKLFANQFIPETELEKERLSYNRMKVTLDMKSENERLFFLFDFPKASEQAYADYEEALRSLDRTKRTSRTRLLNAQVNYLSALMRLQYRQEARRRNQIQLSKYKIYAEQEGLLIYGESGNENRDWDEQIKEGMFVREGMILFTIPDLTRMAFRMKIHESEIDKVKMNQQVQIRVEAFPDERVEGVISKVGVLPSSMSSYFNPEMRLYDVVATVASVHDWIRPGMTAEVRIAVDTVEDALLAPITAVSTRGGEAFCFLATGQRRVVETGNFNDEFIEIRSGLEEGEIIAADPRPFLDGIDDGSGEIKLWMPESMKAQAAE